MGGDDDGRTCGDFGEVGLQPGELGVVDASLPGAVGRGLDGVEDDEVIALVVKRVVGGADALLEELLAVAGSRGFYAAAGEEAEVVMVADGVVDFEAQGLFSMGVEIKEAVGALAIDGERVEYMVAALDGEIDMEGCSLFEGQGTAIGCGQLGLNVGVSDEEVVEGARLLRCGRWWGSFASGGEGAARKQGSGSGDGAEGEEISAVDRTGMNRRGRELGRERRHRADDSTGPVKFAWAAGEL